MSEATHTTDKDTKEFFDEIDKETKQDYETCSVSKAFDAVFQCYTLGSQAIHYYRYGTKNDCSGKWEDFKFCLKTKTKPSEKAHKMLKERQAEKEAVKRRGKNSEEVWELRT